jgi:hypothetical protein
MKLPWREDDHSLPGAEVKNGGAIPPLSHMSSWRDVLLIKHRNKFSYIIFLSFFKCSVVEIVDS